jgi:hypothetical protein
MVVNHSIAILILQPFCDPPAQQGGSGPDTHMQCTHDPPERKHPPIRAHLSAAQAAAFHRSVPVHSFAGIWYAV